MHTKIAVIGLIIFSAANTWAQKQSERTENRRALVEMEHAFAKAAATKGTRDAFIEFLADDGIIFQPGPVNGKKFWTERQPRKGLLSWEPVFADVSRAGDLGYTHGTYEVADDTKNVTEHGSYVRIWQKQGVEWRIVMDVTNAHPK